MAKFTTQNRKSARGITNRLGRRTENQLLHWLPVFIFKGAKNHRSVIKMIGNPCRIENGIAFLTLKRNDGTLYETMIDAEDLPRLDKLGYTWHTYRSKGMLYVKTTIDRKLMYLHRFLMNPPSGMVIDHINHDTLDNRKGNLRIVTQRENNQNRRLKPPSGIIGVSWDKRNKKWKAYITLNGKQKQLGRYKDKNEAAHAVKNALEQLYNCG